MTDIVIEGRGGAQIFHPSGELVVPHTDRLIPGLVAFGWIVKPFSPDHLLAVVRKVLG